MTIEPLNLNTSMPSGDEPGHESPISDTRARSISHTDKAGTPIGSGIESVLSSTKSSSESPRPAGTKTSRALFDYRPVFLFNM